MICWPKLITGSFGPWLHPSGRTTDPKPSPNILTAFYRFQFSQYLPGHVLWEVWRSLSSEVLDIIQVLLFTFLLWTNKFLVGPLPTSRKKVNSILVFPRSDLILSGMIFLRKRYIWLPFQVRSDLILSGMIFLRKRYIWLPFQVHVMVFNNSPLYGSQPTSGLLYPQMTIRCSVCFGQDWFN